MTTSNGQTGSSLILTGVLAAVPAVAGFGVMLVIGQMGLNTSFWLAALIWVAVAAFLVTALHNADRSGGQTAAAPAPAHVAAPVAAPTEAPAAAPMVAATRPAGLSAARDGRPDDLKEIVGVGPVLEKLLHSLGFYHFDQIANWTEAEVAWVDDNLEGFKGRVSRDNWIAQARELAARKG